MISFSRLGHLGRLGNQLFQYAFLRLHARRLSVPFYCPEWIGDSIFHLDDDAERALIPEAIRHRYAEPAGRPGFHPSSLAVGDGTDLRGYFQTERYLDRNTVRRWYRFKAWKVAAVQERFKHVDFSNCAGLHLRLGDFATSQRENYYVPNRRYYEEGLRLVARNQQVLVFSDDIPQARAFLGPMGASCLFVEGNEAFEDLYLQTLCRDFICGPSTFCWWGAWLNAHPDKVIVAPREGPFRPGSHRENEDFWPEDWVQVGALDGFKDHRRIVVLSQWLERRLSKLGRLGARLLEGGRARRRIGRDSRPG